MERNGRFYLFFVTDLFNILGVFWGVKKVRKSVMKTLGLSTSVLCFSIWLLGISSCKIDFRDWVYPPEN